MPDRTGPDDTMGEGYPGEPGPTPAERDATLHEVARAMFPDATAMLPGSPGDHLLRIERPGETWCVRRWRPGTNLSRIAFVHAALRAAHAAEIDAVPHVATLPGGMTGMTVVGVDRAVVSRDGAFFDAQSWVSGRPLARGLAFVNLGGEHPNVPAPILRAAVVETATLLARLHGTMIPALSSEDRPAMTLGRLGNVVDQTWRAHQHRLGPAAPLDPLVRRWRTAGRRAMPLALDLVGERGPRDGDDLVVAQGDLWPAHVMSDRQGRSRGVSGIIDWTDAVAGSPAIDLAHLVAHFGGWRADTVEEVLGAYTAVRPLSPMARGMLPAVATLDLVAEAGYLLTLANQDDVKRLGRDLRDIRDGAEMMIQSLEILSSVLAHGEEHAPRNARPWVRWSPAESGERGARVRGLRPGAGRVPGWDSGREQRLAATGANDDGIDDAMPARPARSGRSARDDGDSLPGGGGGRRSGPGPGRGRPGPGRRGAPPARGPAAGPSSGSPSGPAPGSPAGRPARSGSGRARGDRAPSGPRALRPGSPKGRGPDGGRLGERPARRSRTEGGETRPDNGEARASDGESRAEHGARERGLEEATGQRDQGGPGDE
ncbi:MAG: phosphotransferase [Thermomicrobiales bacterium]